MESGKYKLKIYSFKRAGKYLVEVDGMGDDRWTKVCVKEEIRAGGNGTASKWGREVKKALEGVGDGESWKLLDKGKRALVKENLEKDAIIMRVEGLQGNWGKMKKSNDCKRYKGWKREAGCEKYLLDRKTKGKIKEQWMKLGFGNLGTEKNKGFKEDRCRWCERETECLEHIWVCSKTGRGKGHNDGWGLYQDNINRVLQG